MKTAEETGKAFAEYLRNVLKADLTPELEKKFDEHLSAVSYESQKSVLVQLLDHAKTHWGNVEHWSEVSEAVGNVWQHEIDYIEKCLNQLEDHFNPKVAEAVPFDFLEALKKIFGGNVQIYTTEDILNGNFSVNEPATEAVSKTDEAFTKDKFPQINTFAGMRYEPTHRHIRTGRTYAKLGDASVEATMDHVVIYRNKRDETFTRPINEFIEKFEEIN